MNITLLNALKQIVSQYGGLETLSNARQVKALLSDMAAGEPKPKKTALVACIEQGFVALLQEVPAAERGQAKTKLAERLNRKEGLDAALCADTLDLLEAALFGNVSPKNAPKITPIPKAPAPRPNSAPVQSVQRAKSYFDSGKTLHSRGDYVTAIADYTEAIRLNPNDAATYNNRGNAYYSKGDYYQAIADYTQAIRLNPNDAAAYNNRGNAYANKGDYYQAIADYTQAVRLDPNDANAYFGRGLAYYSKKYYDRAIADYEQAVRIDPNNNLYSVTLVLAKMQGR
jgi:tetratricopeptide (TPR) repeat protein